jgi:hypothetical protein
MDCALLTDLGRPASLQILTISLRSPFTRCCRDGMPAHELRDGKESRYSISTKGTNRRMSHEKPSLCCLIFSREMSTDEYRAMHVSRLVKAGNAHWRFRIL